MIAPAPHIDPMAAFGEAVASIIVARVLAQHQAAGPAPVPPAPAAHDGPMLTVKEAAKAAGYSVSFITRAYSRRGPDRLEVVRKGRSIRIRKSDLDAWIARGPEEPR